MKENNLVGLPLGILKRMEMPKFMNGLVKSMTASLAKLMVNAPMAKSAVPAINSVKNINHDTMTDMSLIMTDMTF